jgi:hypothetical protein
MSPGERRTRLLYALLVFVWWWVGVGSMFTQCSWSSLAKARIMMGPEKDDMTKRAEALIETGGTGKCR